MVNCFGCEFVLLFIWCLGGFGCDVVLVGLGWGGFVSLLVFVIG